MLKLLTLLTIATIGYGNKFPNVSVYLNKIPDEVRNKILDALPEDVSLNSSQLITKYGYPVEVHEIQTKDGYLLTTFRIPHSRFNDHKADARIPLLLMHGLFCSSDDWILSGPNKALAYILADKGYDVWLGNSRGNFYSRKHAWLSPNEREFWNFSWDEMGHYDLPACIDHILKITGYKKLQYVGHSQGVSSFLVMASQLPHMNEKIMSVQGLSPPIYHSHINNVFVSIMVTLMDEIGEFFRSHEIYELFPREEFYKYFSYYFCDEHSSYFDICIDLFLNVLGNNPTQIDRKLFPIILSHIPAGISVGQGYHYLQNVRSGRFRRYDHGHVENMKIYGSETPPDYDLSKVTSPVILYYGDYDVLVNSVDVERVNSELANPMGLHRIPEFTHWSYMWGVNASTILYNKLMDIIKKFNVHK